MSKAALLSLSDIAEMTKKSLPVVSNWRRRNEKTFPPAVDQTQYGTDLFEADAVTDWLRARDIPYADRESQLAPMFWNFAANLRGELAVEELQLVMLEAAVLAALDQGGHHKPISDRIKRVTQQWPDRVSPDAFVELARVGESEQASTVQHILDYLGDFGREALVHSFDDIIGHGVTSRVGGGVEFGEYWTPKSVASLMARLCPEEATTYYDFACGTGGLLAQCLHRSRQSHPHGMGQDLNREALRVAQLRFALLDLDVELHQADTLINDRFSGRLADVVVCDPPFGVKFHSTSMDSRWQFGPTSSADLLWIQHAVAHLEMGGVGLVTTSMGPLFRGGKERPVRLELVRRGAVEAVISLPARMYPNTGIPIALWVLRRPEDDPNPEILFIDASDLGTQSARKRVEIGPEAADRIASLLAHWRRFQTVSPTDREIAASTPRVDVLAADANLTPARWIETVQSPATVLEFQQRVATAQQRAGKILNEWKAVVPLPHLVLTSLTERATIPLERLVTDGTLKVVRSTRTKDLEGSAGGVPVVTASDVKRGRVGSPFGPHHQTEAVDEVSLTAPGDVLVAPLADNRLATMVETSARVPAQGVLVLRIVGDWITPAALSQILVWDSIGTSLSRSTTLFQVKTRDLSIPLLSETERSAISAFFSTLIDHSRMIQIYQDALDDLTVSIRLALPRTATIQLGADNPRKGAKK